jgi:hypothetical protein
MLKLTKEEICSLFVTFYAVTGKLEKKIREEVVAEQRKRVEPNQ